MISHRLADLLGDVFADKPLQAIHLNQATFFNHASQQRWSIAGGGDVLVERLMVLDGQGNGWPLAAIMRRQPGGEWRILRLMP